MVALALDSSAPTNKLQQRGIAKVAARAGWYAGDYYSRPGWYQPIYDATGQIVTHNGDPVRAWKAAQKAPNVAHDTWINYPAGLKPLMLPPKSIIESIAQANGDLLMSEGKADTLTVWAAGKANAAGLFGTSFLPDNFAALLQSWGVNHLTYYAHPDAAGRKVAQKIVNALLGSGIACTVYLLPVVDGKKCDLNDLWIAEGFNRSAFWARIDGLGILPLEPEQAPFRRTVNGTKKPVSTSHNKRLQGWAKRALEGAIADFANSGPGQHFEALKRSANRLGTIAAHGLLTRAECVDGLYNATPADYLRKEGATVTGKRIEKYFDSGFPHPCELPVFEDKPSRHSRLTRISCTPAVDDTQLQRVQWPADMPSGVEDIWLGFKLCLSVLCLLRLVLKAVAAGQLDPDDMTVAQIVDATGLTDRQVRNGLEKDRGVLFTFSAYDLSLSISKNSNTNTPRAENVESLHTAKNRPAQRVQLNPAPVAVQNIIRHIVTAKGKQKLFPNINPDRLAEADPDLVAAAGLNTPGALDMLQKYLAYPGGNAQALQQLANWITEARFKLSNLAPDPLPELPDGKPITNAKRYRAAIVARRALVKHDGGKLSYKQIAQDTKISERQVPELAALSGVGFTKNYNPVRITDVSQLPEPGRYSFDLEGAATKMQIVDSDGVITTLPYSKASAAELVTKREHVIVLAQQAGDPFKKTQAEHEQTLLDLEAQRKKRAEARAAAKAEREAAQSNVEVLREAERKRNRKSAGSEQSRNDTPGYSENFARVWRSRLIEYIAPGAPDELLSMLVGSDTAQLMDIAARFNDPAARQVDGGKLLNFPAPAPIAQPAAPAPIQMDLILPLARSTNDMYTPREDLEDIFNRRNLTKPNPYTHPCEGNSQAAQDLQRWLDLRELDTLQADDFVIELKESDPSRYSAMIEVRATA